MKQLKTIALLLGLLTTFAGYSQEDEDDAQKSNIQQYTPSKLIGKGQFDIKWFNNIYTETESTFTDGKQPRQTFFTSTLEGYTGVGQNNRWNVGVILKIRSNTINGSETLDALKFKSEDGISRAGLTSFAPSVKFVPFESVGNFSIQSSLYIPLVDNETENDVFLDQNGFIWQNRFFYDYTFPGDKWQLFTELNTELNFGDKEKSFANNSLGLTPGVFLSYFPANKFTVLALAQHSQRIDLGNNFSQNYTALGGGAKYQLTNALNLELLYTNFVGGDNTGLGETFNLGLRAIF
ncbi:hypothetical protein AX016_1356 [Cellulophaga sp. RHA19]|uniref:hypothetical protein n=1 Tax=Cellulophaga sp. RHA19 TaxID=1798237 RepID=UPI000C2BFD8D|nr:hypothetical protein [Cellulophaga sp. RHA19]PKB43171.1 hypothetical protein AX016_1356 [Cellulophaga sp. RHA19]